jgi:hypothetical protein
MFRSLNYVIPTTADHRQAMICRVERLAVVTSTDVFDRFPADAPQISLRNLLLRLTLVVEQQLIQRLSLVHRQLESTALFLATS